MNPVAGMGGSVGLKGTDGPEIQREAMARGAQKVAPSRAVVALKGIKARRLDIEFLTADGEMGKDELDAAGIEGEVVASVPARTTGADTFRVVKALREAGADLILFAGGDGTARDVLGAVDATVPILGMPAGVKMHSSVFALTPEKVADAVERFAETGRTTEAEVMDIDEEVFRGGIVQARLYGVAKVPDDSESLQVTKDAYHSRNADEESSELGQYVAENMSSGVVYVLGPGTTCAAVARVLGLDKTVLGVDVILDRRMVLKDASEKDLLRIVDEGRPVKIIVSPVGAQGFFFGRGNQQISAKVVGRVRPENVMVIATPTKLAGTPVLRVDTGDPRLDATLKGKMKVVTGYGRRRLVTVG